MWERAGAGEWALAAGAAAALLYVAGTRSYGFFAARGVASSRPRLPFAGDVLPAFLGFISFPDFLKKIYKSSKGHAVYGLFQFRKPFYLVRDPELLKYITVKGFNHFMNHQDVINGDPDPLFNKNLFSTKDNHWREMRATLSPAFTSSKIKAMLPLIEDCAKQMVYHLQETARESKSEILETNMKDLFTRIANDAIATVAFGLKCDSFKNPKNDFYKHGKSLTIFSIPRMIIFILYSFIPRIMKALQMRVINPKAISFLDSLIQETIQERQKNKIFRPDMLQLLMQARDGKLTVEEVDKHENEDVEASDKKLTEADISAQAMIFFFAGFETVSTALCFITYALAHNSEIQLRLYKEIDETLAKTGGEFNYAVLQEMKLLDAVISESLRMYPPVINLDRECNQDVTLPPTDTSPAVHIRKGDSIVISTMGLHYDPEYWPSPDKFDPDRFSDVNKRNIKPFTYMPFGLGPRACIGQRLALLEIKLALVHLLKNFELLPSPKLKYPMEFAKGFNTSIRGGFWCKLVTRRRE